MFENDLHAVQKVIGAFREKIKNAMQPGSAGISSLSELANLYVIDLAQAHGSLRVIVTVENVPSNTVGQEAWIRVTSGNDAVEIPVIVPDANSFYTELQFETSEVDAGEPISGCVNFNEDLDFEECGYTTYSEDRKPELVDIYLRDSSGPFLTKSKNQITIQDQIVE